MNTMAVSVPVLRWAAKRARLDDGALAERFPKWRQWNVGSAQPTFRQLEDFARLTHTAVGYFFLPQPPELSLPVPDFRTLRDAALAQPSAELLDTLYLCQQRQDWYRDYARVHGMPELAFVGSATVQSKPDTVAASMRANLALSIEERSELTTWTDALRQLIKKAEDAGVLVMASSVVGSNSHRKLDVEEFRGFALADKLAPLIFLNAADSKAAQMFTLAHELAHQWLGATGVSDTQAGQVPEQAVERWCNQVAAELLVPMQAFKTAYRPGMPVAEEIQRLARQFKVSTLVALRRLFDAGLLDQNALWRHYREEVDRLRGLDIRGKPGGNFYRTLSARTGRRFARAIVANTLEGLTSFSEAFRMLGVRKSATFYEAARELGVIS